MRIDKNFINSVAEVEGLDYFRTQVLKISKNLDSKYIFCEVGTRSGNSAIITLDAIKESKKKRWLFTIDPYGDKPYKGSTYAEADSSLDYNEIQYRNAMLSLNEFAFDNELNYCHWRMLSKDFMNNIEQIEFWHNGKKIDYEFGFVFLDGEHYEEVVLNEFNWFKNRLAINGMIVIDDINNIWPSNYISDEEYNKLLNMIFKDGKWNLYEGKLYYIKKK